MTDTLLKIAKVLPRIFLAVFVVLFLLQVVGFFFIYYFSSKVSS